MLLQNTVTIQKKETWTVSTQTCPTIVNEISTLQVIHIVNQESELHHLFHIHFQTSFTKLVHVDIYGVPFLEKKNYQTLYTLK